MSRPSACNQCAHHLALDANSIYITCNHKDVLERHKSIKLAGVAPPPKQCPFNKQDWKSNPENAGEKS